MSEYQSVFERLEIKFLLDEVRYRRMIKMLDGLAEVDQCGETTILNIYYDTPDFYLVRTSMEKPAYKEKLRLRTYGRAADDKPSFIEIKKKVNGIVYKRRTSLSYRDSVAFLSDIRGGEPNEQVLREVRYMQDIYRPLMPRMVIAYERTAMFGTMDSELRITFDRRIRWRTDGLDLRLGGRGREIIPSGYRLMEIKVAGAIPLYLSRILSELYVGPYSFSKYGEGYADHMRDMNDTRLKIAA